MDTSRSVCPVSEFTWDVTMSNVKSFLRASSREMKPGVIIMNQNPKDNPLNGDICPLLPRKVQVGTIFRKTYADIVLGYDWTNSRTLSG
jgi:hypothetical protein